MSSKKINDKNISRKIRIFENHQGVKYLLLFLSNAFRPTRVAVFINALQNVCSNHNYLIFFLHLEIYYSIKSNFIWMAIFKMFHPFFIYLSSVQSNVSSRILVILFISIYFFFQMIFKKYLNLIHTIEGILSAFWHLCNYITLNNVACNKFGGN